MSEVEFDASFGPGVSASGTFTPIVEAHFTDKQVRQTAYAFTYAVALHGLIARGFTESDCRSKATRFAEDCVEGMKNADVP